MRTAPAANGVPASRGCPPLLELSIVGDEVVLAVATGWKLHRVAPFRIGHNAEARIAGQRVARACECGRDSGAGSRLAIGAEQSTAETQMQRA